MDVGDVEQFHRERVIKKSTAETLKF
jgi:hypothetical protein